MNTSRRHAATIATVAILVLAGASPAAIAAPRCRAEYWVASDGSDAAAGDRARPFRTLERARDAVRNDPRRLQCGAVVTLRGGDYRLASTLVLDARDSGAPGREVVWRAAPGRAARDLGRASGERLGAARRGARHPPRIRRAAASRASSSSNGTRAVRARSEAYPADFERTGTGYRFVTPGKTMPVWTNASAIEAVTITQWKMMRCPVASIAGPDIVMREPCWKNANVFQAPKGDVPLWNFRLLTRFENAYEFLDEPGEWYLDSTNGLALLHPAPGEDIATAVVELPVREALIDGRGELGSPIAHIRFEGLTFAYATWLGPSTADGYAADQSGFHLVGDGAPDRTSSVTTRTSCARRETSASATRTHIEFRNNAFVHLGGVGLDFDTGSQHNVILDNAFEDISSAAIQLGGVTRDDHHPGSRSR